MDQIIVEAKPRDERGKNAARRCARDGPGPGRAVWRQGRGRRRFGEHQAVERDSALASPATTRFSR